MIQNNKQTPKPACKPNNGPSTTGNPSGKERGNCPPSKPSNTQSINQ